MRKHGFILLLLVFLLAAMPAVAADFVSVDVPELSRDEIETKITVKEEVAVIVDCEILADQADSITPIDRLLTNNDEILAVVTAAERHESNNFIEMLADSTSNYILKSGESLGGVLSEENIIRMNC